MLQVNQDRPYSWQALRYLSFDGEAIASSFPLAAGPMAHYRHRFGCRIGI
ncbi:MAG: hypothetical protein AAF773_17115 [Cyanobacteria bacterium P01_D01_bin.115]